MKKYRKNSLGYKITPRKLHIIILALTAIILIYFFISNAIIKYLILKDRYLALENQLNKLKKEHEKLKTEIYLLKHDTNTIEYYIRKELKYKKPQEKVIIFKN
ncbi:MAG: septum formation initiator family protein [Endomicrobiia bacterium]